jgi:hypothetical protein
VAVMFCKLINFKLLGIEKKNTQKLEAVLNFVIEKSWKDNKILWIIYWYYEYSGSFCLVYPDFDKPEWIKFLIIFRKRVDMPKAILGFQKLARKVILLILRSIIDLCLPQDNICRTLSTDWWLEQYKTNLHLLIFFQQERNKLKPIHYLFKNVAF